MTYERLLKIAGAMHTWIFLHSYDEVIAYQECGITDEENQELGSIYVGGNPTVEIEIEVKNDGVEQ